MKPMFERRWAKLALSFASLVVTLFLLEFGARMFRPQDPDFYDSSKIMRIGSVRPWLPENIPNGRTNSYIGVPVSINSFGLRGNEISVPKAPHTVRIVGVGDSITFGYGIRFEDTFLKVLETSLNGTLGTQAKDTRYEVLNAGVEGTGLDYYYHFLSTMAPKLEPDVAIVNICLNDIEVYSERTPTPKRAKTRSAYTLLHGISDFLLKHSHLYMASYMRLKSILYGVGILDINRLQGYSFLSLEPDSPLQEKAWDSTVQMLSKIVDSSRKDHYRLVLVVFPMEMQLSPAALHLYRDKLHVGLGPEAMSGEPQRRIQEFGAAHGITVIDLLPAFRTIDTGKLFLRNKAINLDPVHPSPFGNQIAAQEIFRVIEGERHISGAGTNATPSTPKRSRAEVGLN